MSSFAILRTAKIKTVAKIHAADQHNSRAWAPENADPAGKVIELISERRDGKKCIDLFNDNLKKYNIKPGKDAVLAIEYIATFSPDMSEKIDIKTWAKENLEFFKKQHKHGILSVQLHLDESTPHLHIIAMPLIEKECRKKMQMRLCARDFTGGAAKLTQLQDDYADAMKKFSLERGLKNSKATHKSLDEFYKNLQKNIDLASKDLEKFNADSSEPSLFNFKEKFRHLARKIDRIMRLVKQTVVKIKSVEDENRTLKVKVNALTQSLHHSNVSKLEKDLSLAVDKASQLARENDELRFNANTLLADKNAQIAAQSALIDRQEQRLEHMAQYSAEGR